MTRTWSFRGCLAALLLIITCFYLTSCASYQLQGSYQGTFEFSDKSTEKHTFTFYSDGHGQHENHETGITAAFYYTLSEDILTLHYTEQSCLKSTAYTYTFSEEDNKLILKDQSNLKSGSFDRK